MTSPAIARAPNAAQEVEPVGQVYIDFTVRNSYDMRRAREERMPASTVRAAPLAHVLMDTGASHLCLPADAVARLGLELDHEALVSTPTGVSTLRVFRDARVEFEDRSAVVEAIELPNGASPLLGAIPMEVLGIEPDLQNRRVRKLPYGPNGSFITA